MTGYYFSRLLQQVIITEGSVLSRGHRNELSVREITAAVSETEYTKSLYTMAVDGRTSDYDITKPVASFAFLELRKSVTMQKTVFKKLSICARASHAVFTLDKST